MGGEGEVRAFKTAAAAADFAAKEDGMVLESPPTSAFSFATGVPRGYEVPGTPSKVWLVVCGDRGCTCGYAGAFADEATAEARATALSEADKQGLSYWALGRDL